MMKQLISIALASTLLAGCGASEAGERYPLSKDEVRSRLANLDVPLPLMSAHRSLETRKAGDGTVILSLTDKAGRDALLFNVTIEPTEAQETRVALEISGAGKAYPQAMANLDNRPDAKRLYMAVISEEVDAKLDGRAFDPSAFAGELAVVTVGNIATLKESVRNVARADAERKQRAIDDAYANENPNDW